MSDSPQRVRQPRGHRHVTKSASFRGRHVSMPVGALDTELMLAEIHVPPFESRDLTAPKTRFPTEQNRRLSELNALRAWARAAAESCSMICAQAFTAL